MRESLARVFVRRSTFEALELEWNEEGRRKKEEGGKWIKKREGIEERSGHRGNTMTTKRLLLLFGRKRGELSIPSYA